MTDSVEPRGVERRRGIDCCCCFRLRAAGLLGSLLPGLPVLLASPPPLALPVCLICLPLLLLAALMEALPLAAVKSAR